MISLTLLQKTFPGSRVGEFFPFAREVFSYADIDENLEREAMFWAQCGHESVGFTSFEESMYYRENRLPVVWRTRFRPVRSTDDPHAPVFADGMRNPRYYARNSQRLANYVYANRMGNGNTESGDGWKYRGRGPKQITGRSNYEAFQRVIGDAFGVNFVESPELLLDPKWGMWAATWFWKNNNLNTPADKGDVHQCTLIINGGLIGLDRRNKLYQALIRGAESKNKG